MNISIVGNGLSGQVTLYNLLKKLKDKDFKAQKVVHIHQYFSSEHKAASDYSLGILALRGAKRGTWFGNALFDGFEFTKQFFDSFEDGYPKGVYTGKIHALCRPSDAHFMKHFKRRYGVDIKKVNSVEPLQLKLKEEFNSSEEDAYFIYPKEFSEWLDLQIQLLLVQLAPNVSFEKVDEKVHQLIPGEDGDVFLLQTGKDIKSWNEYKAVVLCVGAYSKIQKHLFPTYKDYLEQTRIISGHYLEFKDWSIPFLDKDFCINFHETVFLYRHRNRQLIIGQVPIEGHDAPIPIDRLRAVYEHFYELLNDWVNLPEFEKGVYRSGLRHKGIQRAPFWGEVPLEHGVYKKQERKRSLYSIMGLYKNSLTYVFQGAEKVSAEIIDRYF